MRETTAWFALGVAIVLSMLPIPVFAAGSGNCLDFDGTHDSVVGNGFPTSFSSITLEAWIYHRTLPAARQRYVWLEGNSVGETACILHDGASSPGQLHFYISVGGVYRHVAVNGALQTGKWYHVAGTWDGAALGLFLNGQLVGLTPAVTGSMDGGSSIVAVSDYDNTMDGYIDEVRIWRDARTTEEIRRAMFREPAGWETGLRGYWKFNEGTGSYAYDSAGDVDLGLFGGMTSDDWAPSGAFCGPRSALDFDGSNDYVNVGNDASLDVGNTMTIEAWVKPSNLSSRYGVFSTRFANAAGSFQLEIGSGDGGTGRIAVVAPGTWVAQTGDNALAAGQWTHIAYTRSGTGAGTHTIYVNGMAQTLVSDADYTFVNNTSSKVIGSGTSGGQFLPGRIDEVRVWNVARTAAQIREGMCTNRVWNESGLVGYWRCDQQTGSTLYDWSSHGNHGTLINMSSSDWVESDAFTTWIGCAGTNWATSHNWSRGIVPNSSATSVGILDAALASDPSVAGTYACNTLVIGTGTTLTIGSGHRVTVKGNAWGMGTVAGSGTVELTGAGASHAIVGTFGGVEVDEASGARQMGDLTTNGTLTLTNGTLTIGANTLTLTNAIAGTPENLSGDATSSLTIGGSGTGIYVPYSVTELNNLALNNPNGATQEIQLTVHGTLALTNGAYSIGDNMLTLNGPITVGAGSLTGSAYSSITLAGSGPSTNLPPVTTNNLRINRAAGIGLGGNVTVSNNLYLTNGAFSIGANTLTLNGPIPVDSGSLTGGSTSNITFGGSGASTNLPAVTLNNLAINRANGIGLGGSVTVGGTLTLTNGALSIGANMLTINGPISAGSGSLTGGSSSNITFGGSGASTNLPAVTLNDLAINRANGIGLGGSVTVGGTLTLTNGALSIAANTLTINGPISAGSGSLTGGLSSSITFGGSGASTNLPAITLNNLAINRPNGINLSGNVTVNGTLAVTSGDLNLNGRTVTLGSAAMLSEAEGNTVKGSSGVITTTRTFNAGDLSAGVNIAGMGAEIATDAALGQTVISRGHAAQTAPELSSILRYYDIIPTNNAGLNATLVFRYDDSELNGLTESLLGLGRSTDSGTTWSGEGGTVDAGNETITRGGIDALSRWSAFDCGFHTWTALTGLFECSVAWGDYDNDGDLDVLMAGNTAGGYITRIYRNDGSGVFAQAASLTGIRAASVAWGDYDNDGDLDVLMAGLVTSGRITRIYRNDGSNTFTDIGAGLLGVAYCSVAWGDYDNDGDLDVLMAGYTGSDRITRIYRNDGSDTFTDIGAGLPGVDACSLAWGDYDNDGDLDVLLAGYATSGRITRIYRNDGSDTFTDVDAGLTGVEYCCVALGDYDNDGDLDILMAGHTGSSRITRIYRNDGGAVFTDISAGLPGVYESSVAWGDFDSDGNLDVLVAGLATSGRITHIYRNDGSDAFTDISTELPGVYESSVAWGDYDNDGDLDLLLAGYATSGYITRIYRNDGLRINTVPDVPSNLVASTADEGVTLTWNAAADLATPQAGLTYNLRIGASPGGVETMSPMADVGNGWRRIPALGNANHDTTWAVHGLPDGRYYWSVQAIDHGFAGSAFAAEDSFDVYTGGLTVADSLSGGDLVLHWNVVPPATAYWVFGAVNEPFFVPQMESPFGYRVAVTADTTWSSAAGIADPDANWTYQVIAVDASEQERGRSNRVGEYEFALP